jgi:TolB protein
MTRRSVLVLLALGSGPAGLAAQDTTRVELRLFYNNPKLRPSLVVLPAPGLDSVRTIVERDLDYSDRFELIPLPPMMAPAGPEGINWGPYKAMNVVVAIELQPAPNGVRARLWEVGAIPAPQVRHEATMAVETQGTGDGRLTIHRLSDEIVRWIAGSPGIAATRFLYVSGNRVWQVDSDGYAATPVTPAGRTAYSPSWSPDGRRFAYTEHTDGNWQIVLQTLGTATRTILPTSQSTQNITPSFSPDGRRLAFSRVADRSYAIHQANVADLCCVERLTVGRFAENLNPTYSPDGRRIAYVSTRAGSPQIYVMSADGTDQELLVPYQYRVDGPSFGPDWSPDGTALAFHREAGGTFQVMVFDLATERVRQVTSEGRNEDASWAPDGRHLVFVSNRTGRGQLHVIDLETSRIRVVPTPASAQLPAWSRRFGGP